MIARNLLKALLVLCLAVCLGFAMMFCVAEKEKPQTLVQIPNENEQFLTLQKKYEQKKGSLQSNAVGRSGQLGADGFQVFDGEPWGLSR